MAAHHSYVETCCPRCEKTRIVRKDLLTKKEKLNEKFLCRSCAMQSRPVTWKKDESQVRKNQGAYKSFCKAKRRVKINHKNAYEHVEFRFESYEQFLAELGPRPEGMTLDRIDPLGHYEPGNVRWATVLEQARNRNPRHTWTPPRGNLG